MSYAVFWIQEYPGHEGEKSSFMAHFEPFGDLEMMEALTFANKKRKEEGVSHVTMSSNDPNQVGQMGVESVVDGRTPDGKIYDWVKRRKV